MGATENRTAPQLKPANTVVVHDSTGVQFGVRPGKRIVETGRVKIELLQRCLKLLSDRNVNPAVIEKYRSVVHEHTGPNDPFVFSALNLSEQIVDGWASAEHALRGSRRYLKALIDCDGRLFEKGVWISPGERHADPILMP